MEDNPFGDPIDPFADSSYLPTAYNTSINKERQFQEVYDKISQVVALDKEGLYPGKQLRMVFVKANLTNENLKEIWSLADGTKRGSLTKEELKTALRLIAIAQEGRNVTLEEAKNPRYTLVPKLHGIEDIKFNIEVERPMSPTPGPLSPRPLSTVKQLIGTVHYQEILDREKIDITVLPEKGGTFLKHVNYMVKSQAKGTETIRRYSDFVWLQEVLLKRYPFRIIPPLPPKGIPGTEDDHFIEIRRKGLIRFLEFLGRHPVLKDDENFVTFLKETSSDSFANYKKLASPQTIVEEFYFSPFANQSKKNIPVDAEEMLRSVRAALPVIKDSFEKFVDLFEKITERSRKDAVDYQKMSKEIKLVIETQYPPEWLSSHPGYQAFGDRIEAISKVHSDLSKRAYDDFLESLKHHQSLIEGFFELFVRKNQTTQRDHQSALKKVQTNKEKLSSMSARGKVGKPVDSLVQQIEKDEQDVSQMEERDNFASYCLWNEYIHFNHNKAFLSVILQEMVRHRVKCSEQILTLWTNTLPVVNDLPTTGF